MHLYTYMHTNIESFTLIYIFIISSTFPSLLCIQITIFYHLLSALKISSVTYRSCLLAKNSFCYLKIFLFLPLSFKDIFTGYRIFGWQFLFEYVIFTVSTISKETLATILIVIPCTWCFSLGAFKIYCLSLPYSSFTMKLVVV